MTIIRSTISFIWSIKFKFFLVKTIWFSDQHIKTENWRFAGKSCLNGLRHLLKVYFSAIWKKKWVKYKDIDTSYLIGANHQSCKCRNYMFVEKFKVVRNFINLHHALTIINHSQNLKIDIYIYSFIWSQRVCTIPL